MLPSTCFKYPFCVKQLTLLQKLTCHFFAHIQSVLYLFLYANIEYEQSIEMELLFTLSN
jgi:hypothetical protein